MAVSLLDAGLGPVQKVGVGNPESNTLPLINPQSVEMDAHRALIATDPDTGLPVIHSPPDAPIHSMTAEQIQAIIVEELLREDLERAGVLVRH
jgi:hypothetical protein